MRARRAAPALLLVAVLAGLAGCGSDEPKAEPTFGMTEIAVECDKYAETAKRITDAQAELYTGAGGQEAIDSLVEELDSLKEGAPEKVQTALTELGEAFRDAREIVESRSAKAAAELAAVSGKLADHAKLVTEYIKGQCD